MRYIHRDLYEKFLPFFLVPELVVERPHELALRILEAVVDSGIRHGDIVFDHGLAVVGRGASGIDGFELSVSVFSQQRRGSASLVLSYRGIDDGTDDREQPMFLLRHSHNGYSHSRAVHAWEVEDLLSIADGLLEDLMQQVRW